jgi:hypothetical protein
MTETRNFQRSTRTDAGFTIGELIIAMGIMLVIVVATSSALLKMTTNSRTIWNRTEMHGGVRGATELLQQEVGQAGLVSLPGPITLTAATAVGAGQNITVSTITGLYVGEKVIVDAGQNAETVTLTALAAGQITADFTIAHANGAQITVAGGFWSGIVPPAVANGSTGTVLKLYGDLNADGNMVYVEYTCDTVGNNLYRNVMAWNAVPPKPAVNSTMSLLGNIQPNPGGTPCFTYQTAIVNGNTYVTDVAITLTVQTQQRDPITKQFQLETKTLLNVSPRNVFNVWQLASIGLNDRVQPTPPSITALLQ